MTLLAHLYVHADLRAGAVAIAALDHDEHVVPAIRTRQPQIVAGHHDLYHAAALSAATSCRSCVSHSTRRAVMIALSCGRCWAMIARQYRVRCAYVTKRDSPQPRGAGAATHRH